METGYAAVEPDRVLESEPDRRNSGWLMPIGILLGLFGAAGVGLGAIVALLTANACGAFADGCDDYGQPAPGFYPAVGLVLMCGAAAVAGLVMVVVGVSKRTLGRR